MSQIIYNPSTSGFSLKPLFKKRLNVGMGAVEQIGIESKNLGGKNLLILTDEGIVKAGLVDKVKEPLEMEGLKIAVFDKVEPEPRIEGFNVAAEFAREGGYDLVIGVGGGSVMDTAKTTAMMLTNPGKPLDYVGENLVKNPLSPLILVPTTAGTGSEISSCAVVTVGEFKNFICDTKLVADVAIIDPLMSVGMPPKLTASTGMDALAHAVEGVLALSSNPFSDALALSAIRLIANNLRTAYYQGGNLEARYNMAIAAAMAIVPGVCILAHSVGQTFSPKFKVPHGISVATPLPHTMEYCLPVAQKKLALIANAMGEDVRGLSLVEAAKNSIQSVVKLIKDLDLPTSLKEINIPQNHLPELVEDIVSGRSGQKRNLIVNPRVITKERLADVIERMWRGDVET